MQVRKQLQRHQQSCVPLVSALRKAEAGEFCEFKGSPVNIWKDRSARATESPVSKHQKKKKVKPFRRKINRFIEVPDPLLQNFIYRILIYQISSKQVQ